MWTDSGPARLRGVGNLGNVLERFATHLQDSGLVPPGSRVAVALSGGADSLCLLHLTVRLGLDVVALHLDHGQRPESADEARRLGEFCDRLNVPFASGRADVPALAEAYKVGVEEAGRTARYDFFRQAAYRTGCDLVATGHTRDDLAETVLFNLVRGTGMAGLAGIPAVRDGFVRPLLPFTRAETRAYCHSQGLEPLEDPGNLDLQFSRVRIRQNVMPELEQAHPGAAANIARTAKVVGEESAFLDSMAAAVLEKAETPLNGPLRFLTSEVEVALDLGVLLSHPDVLVRRGLRLAAAVLGASLDHGQTETLHLGVRCTPSGSVTSDGGRVVAQWSGDRLHFARADTDGPFRFNLATPGITESDVFGWQITVQPWPPADLLRDPDNLDVAMDAAKLHGGLHFRSTDPGDAMVPLGMTGSKSVADMMREAGLTASARRRLPVVCDMVGAVWVPGCRIAERVKITDTTARAFRLTFGPLDLGRRQEEQERTAGA